jgi:hypothetical protein
MMREDGRDGAPTAFVCQAGGLELPQEGTILGIGHQVPDSLFPNFLQLRLNAYLIADGRPLLSPVIRQATSQR